LHLYLLKLSLIDPRLVNPGSTLIHIGAYVPKVLALRKS